MSDQSEITIVGGGLSGILLALKLSRNEVKKIVLLDEQSTLGGRLFFASSFAQSGFGFEHLDLKTKESLYRHIENSLTEHEKIDLENYLSQFTISGSQKNNCYFVKKEWTTPLSLINGSNELLTKKESEYLKLLLENTENSKDTSLFKGDLKQIFSSLIGERWEGLPFSESCLLLKQFFLSDNNNYFLPFQRNVSIELFLEDVLKKRGVEIRLCCKLIRVDTSEDNSFTLILSDEKQPENKYLQTNKLVLAIPLAKCAGLLPKEIYMPEQAKFISKIQPLSLVVYEVSHFSKLKAENLPASVEVYDKFVFPVERAKAFYTSDDRLLFYTELDYEDSHQAPAVREAVGRLKRAASRLLNQETAKEMKKGFRMPQGQSFERVILLPVAQSVPYTARINFELKQSNMRAKNLFCCGDSFFSLADEPWKRVIHSVNDISQKI
jgi:hypothetical protein